MSAEHAQTLFSAASSGDATSIYLLIDSGANPFTRGTLGRTPLHLAAVNGDTTSMMALLSNLSEEQRTALLNQADDDGRTPLHLAALGTTTKHHDAIGYLIDQGANVDQVTTDDNKETPLAIKETPLAIAAFNNNVAIAVLLVSKGANINFRKNDGQTPFTIAVRYERHDLQRQLIQAYPHNHATLVEAKESIKGVEDHMKAPAIQLIEDAEKRAALSKSIARSGAANENFAGREERRAEKRGCCAIL